MSLIRVVWGAATAPTAMASYDAALAAANVHNYNLVAVSSVIPAEAAVEAVGTAPNLGPAGQRLTVVEARQTVAPHEAECAVAGLGWAREPDGPGIFYEASGTDRDDVTARIEAGLEAGRELREWSFADGGRHVVETAAATDAYTTALVLAVYGESTPIL